MEPKMASVVGKVIARGISSSAVVRSGQSATAGHGGGWQLWKKLSFFVAVPGVALCMLNVYLGAMQEDHQPPFVPYEHMRIRNKRFPWGDGQKSLFHNPHLNALPSGYENRRALNITTLWMIDHSDGS